MSKGIAIAGNLVVDISYPIERWPREGELTTITEGVTRSTGGAVCNVAMDLSRLDPTLPVSVLGVIGLDAEGDYICSELGKYQNIDTSLLSRSGTTSFTAVMSNIAARTRTFFQYRGANALFDESFIDWERLRCDILHVGYIMLLDALDRPDSEYGTAMARLLRHARDRGIRTSVDTVSETGGRYSLLVPPALRYTDFLVINEIEAQGISGIELRDARGNLLREHMKDALGALMSMGVSVWSFIHCPEMACGMDAGGGYAQMDSLRLPDGYIAGTVGAGDAFGAGVLLAAHRGWGLEEALELAVSAAAASLSRGSACDGVGSLEEVLELYRLYAPQQ